MRNISEAAQLHMSVDDPKNQSLLENNSEQVQSDSLEKQRRLRVWMAQHKYDGVLISRRDQFAWLTTGGDNRVLNNATTGEGHLLVTPDRQYLLAHSMDALRLFEEQIAGQLTELVALRWYEGDPREHARRLAGPRLAADTLLSGVDEVNDQLNRLHFPLSSLEIARLRWLAGKTNNILEEIAIWAQPGMSEEFIARQMHIRFIQEGIDLDVLIVGSDDRVARYRHPLPTRKVLERYLMLHPAARRWGLHANITRSVSFGLPTPDVRIAFQAAATVEAYLLAMLQPGVPFADILSKQKEWYTKLGYPGEWENHYQGGPTGYAIVDATRCLTDTTVEIDQSFDWFITVTGAKVEELTLLTEAGVEILSFSNNWPGLTVELPGTTVCIPNLLVV